MARIITCADCGRDRPHLGHGLCRTCWSRTRPRYDQPTGAGPGGAGVSRKPEAVKGRIEDYVELTRDHKLNRRDAVARLGISYRTATRYEARLKKEAAA